MTRESKLCSLINVQGRGLEIGPGYNPLLPKRDGFTIETADYTDADGLRRKYAGNSSVDISRIEAVDHVLGEGGLFHTIQKQHHFDYIVASHVIEHTPDMIGFLKDCENLLAPDGVLVLAVPDKRYCFDVLQPLTSIGQAFQAFIDRRKQPPLGAILDDRIYNAVRNGAIGWDSRDSGALTFFVDIAQARSIFAADRVAQHYTDVHVWKFVPSSFRLILNDLYELGEIGLREATFDDSGGHEFYCSLSVSGGGCGLDRLTLARRTLAEQAMISGG
jgi:SAM-dependent methyltransferase